MLKRIFDIIFSLFVLISLSWFILLLYILACFDTNSNGFFVQNRVGKHGKIFKLYKIKSMKPNSYEISSYGRFLRKYKLDELPQFFNVILGNMSVVGPRPDIEGYYDRLQGENRAILKLKPGITSEASLKYRNEESLLENHSKPIQYNDEVIFPDKVKMNLDYYYNQSIIVDLKIIIKTVKVFFSK